MIDLPENETGPIRSHSGGAENVPAASWRPGYQSRDGGSIRPSRFTLPDSRIQTACDHLRCSGARS